MRETTSSITDINSGKYDRCMRVHYDSVVKTKTKVITMLTRKMGNITRIYLKLKV